MVSWIRSTKFSVLVLSLLLISFFCFSHCKQPTRSKEESGEIFNVAGKRTGKKVPVCPKEGKNKIINLADKNFDKFLLARPYSLVYIYSKKCPQCIDLIKTIVYLDKKYKKNKKISIGKFEYDSGDKPKEFCIDKVPTILFFQRDSGYINPKNLDFTTAALENFIDNVLLCEGQQPEGVFTPYTPKGLYKLIVPRGCSSREGCGACPMAAVGG